MMSGMAESSSSGGGGGGNGGSDDDDDDEGDDEDEGDDSGQTCSIRQSKMRWTDSIDWDLVKLLRCKCEMFDLSV